MAERKTVKLYCAYDEHVENECWFRSLRAAKQWVQEQEAGHVDRCFIPKVTLGLLVSVLNETGFVLRREKEVYRLERKYAGADN